MTTPYGTRDTRQSYGYREDYDPNWDRQSNWDRPSNWDRQSNWDRRHRDDRGFFDRAGDEMRSWFGDEEAERRRRRDEFESERGRGRGNWSPQRASGDARAGDLMTRNVTTVTPRDSIERAARLMRDCDCGALPVINNNGRLIGMITDRDIVMRLAAQGVETRHAVVADAMTNRTFACHVNDRLEGCARQMARHRVRRLPIVNDDDQVIGIISQGDLARHAEMYEGRGERRRFTETLSQISEPSSAPYR